MIGCDELLGSAFSDELVLLSGGVVPPVQAIVDSDNKAGSPQRESKIVCDIVKLPWVVSTVNVYNADFTDYLSKKYPVHQRFRKHFTLFDASNLFLAEYPSKFPFILIKSR